VAATKIAHNALDALRGRVRWAAQQPAYTAQAKALRSATSAGGLDAPTE